MRYIFIALLLLNFTGCGSNEKQGITTVIQEVETNKPISPKTEDVANKPPSIPDI